jgi:hypothetical protein
MALSIGARLGPYEILPLLGAGTFTHEPERLPRFRREAHVLAALNRGAA